MELHKFFILLLAFLVTVSIVALIVVEVLFTFIQSHPTVKKQPSQQNSEIITVTGTQTCLPHQNQTGPQTLECAIGLKTKTNDYYGLENIPQEDLIANKLSSTKPFTVKGLLTHPASKYATLGTIKVYSLVY